MQALAMEAIKAKDVVNAKALLMLAVAKILVEGGNDSEAFIDLLLSE